MKFVTELKNKKGLRGHFNIVHNLEKEHQCNICQKGFNFQSRLNNHVKIVHENSKKDHKCESCEKSFSSNANIKIHFDETHEGKKEHKCD